MVALERVGLSYGAKTDAEQAVLFLQNQRNIQNNMTKGGSSTVATFPQPGPPLLSPNQGINSTIQRMASAQAQASVNSASAQNIGKPINGGKKSRKRIKKNRKSLKRRTK